MKRIVVGTDGSDSGLVAIEWALDEAGLRGADLDVISTWDLPPLGYFDLTYDTQRLIGDVRAATQKVAEHQLEEARKRHPERASVYARVEAVRGSAARRLVEAASGADLLVVGSSGAGAWSRTMWGSVSTACVAMAHTPVLVVPHSTRESAPSRRDLVTVGIDLWHPDLGVVDVAAIEAAVRGARLRIAACWEVGATAARSAESTGFLRAFQPGHAREIAELAREQQAALPADRIDVEVTEGDPGRQLAAWTTTSDLVVIGNRHLPLWRRVFDHSTSSYVTHHAHGPVLVVPGTSTTLKDGKRFATAGASAS